MASKLLTAIYVLGLLVCGSLNTITLKVSYTLSAEGIEGEEKLFKKPWFTTFIMFVAMLLALCFDRSMRRCEPCLGITSSSMEARLLPDASPGTENEVLSAACKEPVLSWSKKVCMVSMPAVFDILATGLCSMGMLYIPASVFQLLRGAEMVFAAAFAIFCLKRKLYAFHWLGLLLCCVGITCVGLASVWGTGHGGDATSGGVGMLLFGMALTLAGQVVQAAQVVAEEWLLVDVDLPEMQIVGFEGWWGMLVMLVAVFPALYWLPGDDNGHFEDEADALVMIGNSTPLWNVTVLGFFSCLTYNMAGIAVTGALSSVHRVMIEAFRTCVVWAFGLAVHYCYDSNSKFGEVWTPYSWLEVLGFFVLLAGQATYGAMLKFPGLYYPPTAAEEPQAVASPGSMRNLASPLPPAGAIDIMALEE